jgi:hypothetical protein
MHARPTFAHALAHVRHPLGKFARGCMHLGLPPPA